MNRLTLAVVLLLIFLLSAGIHLGFLQHATGYTPQDAVDSLRAEIVSMHGVFLAILVGGIFAGKPGTVRISGLLAAVSIVLAVAWSVFLLASWSGYVVKPPTVDAATMLAQLSARAKEGSFLVAGMLAYLCNAPAQTDPGKGAGGS